MYDTCTIVVAGGEAIYGVESVLQKCGNGLDHILDHEQALYDTDLLSGPPSSQYALLKMEHTLLQMASETDVTKGVVYFIVVPDSMNVWTIRYVTYTCVTLSYYVP